MARRKLALIFLLLWPGLLLAEVNIFKEAALAQELMAAGRYSDSEKIWQRLVTAEPDYSIGLNNLAFCQLKQQNYVSALENYRKAEKISPNIDARAGIQWSLLLLKRYDESIAAAEKALQLDDANYWVHVRLAAAYNAKRDYGQAEVSYDRAVQTHGATAQAYYEIGLYNRSNGNHSAANKYLTRGYQKDSQHRGIRSALALYPSVPYGILTPYYQLFQFSDTAKKDKGSRIGAYGTFAFNDYWFVGAGFSQWKVGNLTTGGDFETSEISAHLTHFFDYKTSFTVQTYYLTGNDSFANNAVAVIGNLVHGRLNRFSISAGGLFFPQHTGAQVSPSYLAHLFGPLWFEGTLTGQFHSFSTETTTLVPAGPPNPPSVMIEQKSTSTSTEVYGAADASLFTAFSLYAIGGGVRFGKLYTPYLLGGTQLIHNTEELKNGFYGFLRIYPARFISVNIVYSYDQWSNIDSENPVSNSFLFSLNARLP